MTKANPGQVFCRSRKDAAATAAAFALEFRVVTIDCEYENGERLWTVTPNLHDDCRLP